MNYIVLDLEWNQPFDLRCTLKRPVLLHGEIIQIGAVKTDEDHHILDTFKILVKPKLYTRMTGRVYRLIYEMNDGSRQYYMAKKQHAEEARAAYLERIAAEA